jgi:murein DD-endopeptidase MepM/ murein hydrolase activator NlpD
VKTLFWVFVLAVLIGAPATLFLLSSSSSIELQPKLRALGPSNQIGVRVANPHGVRLLRVILQQGTAQSSAGLEESSNRFLFWRRTQPPLLATIHLSADPKLGFRSGPARLTIEATANDFRGRVDARTWDLPIVLAPPAVVADGLQHYINQGGADLVTLTVSGYWTEAGVRVGQQYFRSYPLPGGRSPNERFCLYGWPWNVPATVEAVVYARNPAGVEVTGHFWQKVTPKRWRKRELVLADPFLQKVVEDIDPSGQGSLLDRFLRINGPMRVENNKTLSDLRLQTEERFLWSTPFQQLGNTKVEAQFADIRTYIYGHKKVDEQTHLGFDLSSVAHAPVEAANSGKVVFAGRLGIYGNCVVVDHGYGLQSIYGHLSEILVKPGDLVKRRQLLGHTGSTGLAGGDHLHFSMQLDGVEVNPIEWWDPHWIHDHILARLPEGTVPPASADTK